MIANVETKNSMKSGRAVVLDYIAKQRWVIPLACILIYIAVYSIIFSDIFLSSYNISSLLLEFSIPSIIVIGMAIQLINGEIDLSVGYNVMFSNMCAGALIVLGVPVIGVILITLAITSLFGFIIGTLVARVGVNSFIASLGMGLFYYGMTQFIYSSIYSTTLNNIDIQHLPEYFTSISKFELFGIQLPVYYAAALLILFSFMMAKLRYFRKYYFIGMNKEAAYLSGINVKSMKTMAFVFSAMFASIGRHLADRKNGCCCGYIRAGLGTKNHHCMRHRRCEYEGWTRRDWAEQSSVCCLRHA